jgi:hypothetical protein
LESQNVMKQVCIGVNVIHSRSASPDR